MKRFIAVVALLCSTWGVQAIAGMKDVPAVIRGTQWTGYYSGCGNNDRVDMDATVYQDAHYILRFHSRYGYPRFDGYYGGYINYDPVLGSLQFNPEQDVNWFTRPKDNWWRWNPAPLKVWSFPWGYPSETMEGKVGDCGNFHLTRIRG